jgi:hydroxylamine reductase
MFCFQCEQTMRPEGRPDGQNAADAGCATAKGVCGKDEATSDLQDVLIYQLQGIGQYRTRLAALGHADPEADSFILSAMFTTLTNVNFNRTRFVTLIAEATRVRDRLRSVYEAASGTTSGLDGPAAFVAADTLPDLQAQAATIGVRAGIETVGADVIGLRALLLYGLKGVAAYAHHAEVLGERRDTVSDGIARALDVLASGETDLNVLLEEALTLGRCNFAALEALDAANTGTFGTPSPSAVWLGPTAGKAILVSGHDLRDLAAILEATKDTGINVYTHGELLPAHGYPKLRAYPHLAGNYGSAWQNQHIDFAAFPGAIVMTSNCLIEPLAAYRNRIFTAGPVGWPGLRHIGNGDFSAVVQAARALPGFTETEREESLTVGFGRDAVLGVAGSVIEAVKSGALKHFFLIGGCDGAAPGRNYYTEFAEAVPVDSMILALGCGKYRFITHDFGTVAGLPRLLDLGQCNDCYSALVIAQALAAAFECGVNDLPLSLIISWFEQKAAAVFLTLLALGVRNVRLGPTLPAFLTPALLDILVDRFGIQPITTARADVAHALSRQAA